MQITFLGTSAAEGFPDPFCVCQNCEDARDEGGRSLRLHSAALVNDDLLIDLGPDLIAAGMYHRLRLNAIPYALQTHPHNDHLDAVTLFARYEMCQVRGNLPLHLHCSAATVERIDEAFANILDSGATFRDRRVQERFSLQIAEISPWQEFTVGPYRVQSVPANHAPGLDAMLYAIEDTRSGGRLFYGTDTGSLPSSTWTRLAAGGWAFDLLVMDHTFGVGARSGGHMNQAQFLAEVAAARDAGVITDSTRIIATHIAHHGNPAHGELSRLAADLGYEVAFDGWIVDARDPVHDQVTPHQVVAV